MNLTVSKRCLSVLGVLVTLTACGGEKVVGVLHDAGADASVRTGPYDECGNGMDDDNDGQIDEGCFCGGGETQPCFTGVYPNRGVGACADGVQACDATSRTEFGHWGACTMDTLPAEEACDGVDNDCDGAIDEGCPCTAGQTQGCGSEFAIAPCSAGTQTCGTDGTWSACEGAVGPSAEVCGTGAGDGIDNDCDGETDEGCSCVPQPEVCSDGVDNDCDGTVDEAACRINMTLPDACVAEPTEVCGDGVDNDCDGDIDELDCTIRGGLDGGADGAIDLDGGVDAGIVPTDAAAPTTCSDGLCLSRPTARLTYGTEGITSLRVATDLNRMFISYIGPNPDIPTIGTTHFAELDPLTGAQISDIPLAVRTPPDSAIAAAHGLVAIVNTLSSEDSYIGRPNLWIVDPSTPSIVASRPIGSTDAVLTSVGADSIGFGVTWVESVAPGFGAGVGWFQRRGLDGLPAGAPVLLGDGVLPMSVATAGDTWAIGVSHTYDTELEVILLTSDSITSRIHVGNSNAGCARPEVPAVALGCGVLLACWRDTLSCGGSVSHVVDKCQRFALDGSPDSAAFELFGGPRWGANTYDLLSLKWVGNGFVLHTSYASSSMLISRADSFASFDKRGNLVWDYEGDDVYRPGDGVYSEYGDFGVVDGCVISISEGSAMPGSGGVNQPLVRRMCFGVCM